MDDMESRHMRTEVPKRRPRQRRRIRNDRQTWDMRGKAVWKFVKTYKPNIITGGLLLLILILLFGVASELQPPSTGTPPPPNVTVIDYSAFVKQVEAGNVLAATIQGNQVNGLLAQGLSATSANPPQVQTTAIVTQSSSDYAAWERLVTSSNPAWMGSSGPTIDPSRSVYTQVPLGSQDQLMALLLSKHTVVTTIPVAQSAAWLNVVWRFVPILLLVLLLFGFLSSSSGNRLSRNIDERISQIAKTRARRFVRAKETNTPRQGAGTTPAAPRPGRSVAGAPNIKTPSARVITEIPVTFADVAGIDEVRADLEEIVRFLRSPEQFRRLGARIPRGALLVGPPGTGKTLLAKAVAGEANVPFFSMSASEFVEMFVGVGASRVRDLFNQARQVAPSVIFIDEIDAVGRKRTIRAMGNDERDQTLNQLLVELDGFNERQAVVVMAATNRLDMLDKALLRPGRFDRRITVSLPDRVGREAILRVHTRKTPLHEEVSLERLARMTTGMSGADLANLVNEAALLAARRDLEQVTHQCFDEALARVQLGAVRPIVMSEAERRIIAFHESGHALVAHYLDEADTVNRVTILPRGQSLGVTQFIAEEDRYNYSRETLMARIAVGLGGRVAEELVFGADRITTGAENDLQVVTDLARRMVTRWGMSELVGVVFADTSSFGAEYSLNMRCLPPEDVAPSATSLAVDGNGQFVQNVRPNSLLRRDAFAMAAPTFSPNTGVAMSALIDAEVRRILDEGRTTARTLLTSHRDQLDLLAEALMTHEQLDRTQFEALLSGK
jgi:ATP-dependent metalloprotease FtsH